MSSRTLCSVVGGGETPFTQLTAGVRGSRILYLPTVRPPWRNWLARSAVNRKVGGSSPPGGVIFFLLSRMQCQQVCPLTVPSFFF